MSRHLKCPGCEADSRGVLEAFEGELRDACPNCGLAGTTIRDVYRVRETHASKQMKAEFEALAVRVGNAERENVALRSKLGRIRRFFGDFNWDGWEDSDDD